MSQSLGFIDLGNSRCKLAWREGAGSPQMVWAECSRNLSPSELAARVGAQLGGRQGVVASVRSDAYTASFLEAMSAISGSCPRLLSLQEGSLIELAYEDVSRFGLDRYLDLVGARAMGVENGLVIDAGTALTFDALVGGDHQGGCIFPGAMMLERSLYSGGDRIVSGSDKEGGLFAKSTEAAVRGGVFTGFASAVSGIAREMLESMPGDTEIIVTGGDLDLVRSALGSSLRVESNLLFVGMETVAMEP